MQESIRSLLVELSSFSSNDILLDVSVNKVFSLTELPEQDLFSLAVEEQLMQLIQKATNLSRETGIQPLCLASGTLLHLWKGKMIHTPLVLCPLHFKIEKGKGTILFEKRIEESFINPFLVDFAKRNFDLTIPAYHSYLELVLWLNTQLDLTEISDNCYLGNFHHHRYQLLKELEELQVIPASENTDQIFGNDEAKNSFALEITDQILFPSDNDHLEVFEVLNEENCVIQGPPGTGKSQVLSNVLAKCIHAGYSTLVVSEKRVALEVLQKKVGEYQLDHFTCITTSETTAHDFLKDLEETWLFVEQSQQHKNKSLRVSTDLKHNLQYSLNLLKHEDLVGGISFPAFKTLAQNLNLSSIEYISNAPSIAEWIETENAIASIFETKSNLLLRFLTFQFIHSSLFENFDRNSLQWLIKYEKLQQVFGISTPIDLDNALKKAAICQLFSNEFEKSYFDVLIPNSAKQKKYLSLKKKLHKLESFQEPESYDYWVESPTLLETNGILDALKNGKFLAKRKAKKRLKDLLKSGFIDPHTALEQWKNHLEQEEHILKLAREFDALGVKDYKRETSVIDTLIQRIREQDYSAYLEISEDTRQNFNAYHRELSEFRSILKTHFSLADSDNLKEIFNLIPSHFEAAISHLARVRTLNENTFKLFKKATTFEHFKALVFKANWVKFECYFPDFAQFSYNQLASKINEILAQENVEHKLFAAEVMDNVIQKFEDYHQLLRTAPSKLDAEKKAFKKKLQRGKALLVKEFAKTRNHPTIRELLKSEANEWIKLLKPIWLSNPSQVSKYFPLEAGFFDLTLFDEASQIPLAHSIGSIHRGKRILIAGDEQQMGPSQLFKSSIEEQIDVLHQASFYFKKVQLKHHYRSQYPELIAFSNKHFYDNQLISYPSAYENKQPVRLHFCATGTYEENQNLEEAKYTAELLNTLDFKEKSVGVIAFSEVQLSAILHHLLPAKREEFQQKIESNQLFFKTLENVQGEECDVLIVSMGYGKNSAGEFHMRFGPLNTKNGARRLNVLFTRAKHTIHFVTSVRSTDFKFSKNESIRLLKLFLAQIENQENESKFEFPYGLKPEIDVPTKTLTFHSIESAVADANELVTLHRALSNRGWKIAYS